MDSILEEMMTRLSELKNEVNAIGRLAKLMASKTIIYGEQQVEELEKEDIIRKAILEINNVYFTSTKGIRYLIRYSSDWIAVFRILVDWGMLKENSFSKFEEMCSTLDTISRGAKFSRGSYFLIKAMPSLLRSIAPKPRIASVIKNEGDSFG